MKRILFLLAIALLAIIIGCSEKLPTPPTPLKPDTVVVHDTIPEYDTTVVHDTTIRYDTTFVHDTTFVVDTVYLDTNQTGDLCGEIGSCKKSIAWFIPLTPGDYQFDFSGMTEKDQPAQELTVTIGSTPYLWPIAEQKEISFTQHFTSYGTWVIITSNPPPARGHEIHVCLQVRKL